MVYVLNEIPKESFYFPLEKQNKFKIFILVLRKINLSLTFESFSSKHLQSQKLNDLTIGLCLRLNLTFFGFENTVYLSSKIKF